jgi:hypothetical protein
MKRWVCFLVAGCALAGSSGLLGISGAVEKGRVISPGDFFPDVTFPMTLTQANIEYLGLPQKFFGLVKGDSFSLKDVKSELIFVEFLNTHCFSCGLQAPVMNQVFALVKKDPNLEGRVKFFGVAAGNNQREVDSYREAKQIPFPIVPDLKFQAYEAIGDPGATPLYLILRRSDSGLVVVRMKVGLVQRTEMILKDLNESLHADINALLKQYKDPLYQQAKAKKLRLPYTESELLKKAEQALRDPKWKVLNVAKVSLTDEEAIYVGEIESGKQKSFLFARLASRAPTCDVCHVSHFFFTFNEKGMIVNFLPLNVTKVDNIPWDGKEIEKMRQRLVGRSVLEPVDFDSQVDAVATATMTAALIVDSVNKAKSLYLGLKSKGYIKN